MCKVQMRWVLVILSTYGIMINYAIRSNLSILLVSMVNHTELKRHEKETIFNKSNACGIQKTEAKNEEGRFIWNKQMQGFLLSGYFLGYMITQVPGGRMAEVFSAKWVLFFGVLINIMTTLLTPLAAEFNYYAVLVIRIIQGLGGGPLFPSIHVLMAKWTLPKERHTMTTIVFTGTSLGTVSSVCVCGYIAKYYGWQSAFYTVGIISSAWLLLWGIFISDIPASNKFISEEEKERITSEGVGNTGGLRPKFPLVSILKSPPFWAICISHFCNNWGFYLLLTQTPIYFKFEGLNLTNNTLSSSFPYLLQCIFSIILAYIMDRLFRANKLRLITVRKLCTSISCLLPATGFLILCYVGCHVTIAVVVMSATIVATGAHFIGFLANHVDISPNFAGSLMGMTNQLGTLSGIIVPVFVGFVRELDHTVYAWRIIFFITIGLYLLEFIVYTIFAEATVQDWNQTKEE